MAYTLPELEYDYTALEPIIDEQTMIIHHTKHHATYVAKLNAALEAYPELMDKSIESLVSGLDSLPEEVKTPVRNHGGGHANHSLFWEIMKPGGSASPSDELLSAINAECGDFETFKSHFTEKALSIFGSGWAWLVKNGNGLKIISTPNQDSPLTTGSTPVLGLDVWEHAYYLKHKNDRAAYINAWWQIVNWDVVSRNFNSAK